MLAYVLNKYGDALMPCAPRKAKALLDNGKAKVVSRLPFVIKLLNGSSGYKQEVELKVDSGSKTLGCAAVAHGDKVIYASEVSTRKDIHKKMEQRAMLRRSRRGRKTRYRPARFNNRRRTDGWLTPTMRSKVHTHIKEINFVKSILPVSSLTIETAQFDIHKIVNPSVQGTQYQQGRQKDFYNVKAYILNRDEYTCQKCKSNKQGLKLHVHHIVFKDNGGTNSPDNLIILCKACHGRLHKHQDAQKESLKLQARKQISTKHATQVATIGSYLKKELDFKEAFGYHTKYARENLNLPKAHFVDAMCVGLADGQKIEMPDVVYKKQAISCGDYSQTASQPGKSGKTKRFNRRKIIGFSRLDRVKYFGTIAFIKGRRATGFAVLSDINGKNFDFGHTPKSCYMIRYGARKSCKVNYLSIKSFTSNSITYNNDVVRNITSKQLRSGNSSREAKDFGVSLPKNL